MPWTAPNQVHIVAWAGWEVCDGAHCLGVMKKGHSEEWGGAHTHTFARNANVWGTRRCSPIFTLGLEWQHGCEPTCGVDDRRV